MESVAAGLADHSGEIPMFSWRIPAAVDLQSEIRMRIDSTQTSRSWRCHAGQTAVFSLICDFAESQEIALAGEPLRIQGSRAVALAMPVITLPFKGMPMSHRTLLPGRAYRFLYPRHNFEGVRTGLEERRVLVEQVRDTTTEPLDTETLISNPLLKRGRWLVTGLDLDKDEERSFYVESMIAVVEIRGRRPVLDESPFAGFAVVESAI